MNEGQRFLEAVKAADLAQLKRLLAAHPDLLSTRQSGSPSAMLLAAYHGHAAVRDFLLAAGLKLDVLEAAALGESHRVSELLAEDAGPANAYSGDGFTALGLAAFFGHRETVEVLLERGADVNAPSRNATGYTALTAAVARGHAPIVAMLLSRGARVDHRYGPGHTVLHEAAARGSTEIVKLLLDHGADANARTDDGRTPLAFAESKGQAETAALLRRRGAVS